jgi:hypothetical protein
MLEGKVYSDVRFSDPKQALGIHLDENKYIGRLAY